MAFGTGNDSFGPNAKIYSFQIKTKDLPAPHFEVRKKVGDKYEPLSEKVTRVSGHVVSLQHKVFKYDNKDIKSVTVTFRDGDDVYFVTVGYTFIGRNILNSILSLKTFDQIEIALYQSKPKPDAINKTGFASASVRQGPERTLIKGLLVKEQLPEIKKIKINGQNMSDTTDIDEFFEKKIVEFAKIVRAAAQATPPVVASHSEAPAGSHSDSEGADAASIENPDDPPF
jgi:hypothetical protein